MKLAASESCYCLAFLKSTSLAHHVNFFVVTVQYRVVTAKLCRNAIHLICLMSPKCPKSDIGFEMPYVPKMSGGYSEFRKSSELCKHERLIGFITFWCWIGFSIWLRNQAATGSPSNRNPSLYLQHGCSNLTGRGRSESSRKKQRRTLH